MKILGTLLLSMILFPGISFARTTYFTFGQSKRDVECNKIADAYYNELVKVEGLAPKEHLIVKDSYLMINILQENNGKSCRVLIHRRFPSGEGTVELGGFVVPSRPLDVEGEALEMARKTADINDK